MAIDFTPKATSSKIDFTPKQAPTAIPQPVAQPQAPQLSFKDKAESTSIGVAQSLLGTAVGTAGLFQKAGLGIMAAVNPNKTYQDYTKSKYGLEGLKSGTAESETIKQALTPQNAYQTGGKLAADIGQYIVPASRVNKATQALPFAWRILTRTAPDIGISAAQSQGDAGITGTVGASSLVANALIPGPVSSIGRRVMSGLAPGYVADVGTGLTGARGEERTGAGAFIPGIGTALGGTIGTATAIPTAKARIQANGSLRNPEKIVNKRVKALSTVAGTKGPLYKTVEAVKRKGVKDPLRTIAETDLLVGAVDSNGTINAKNALENFQDVVRPYEARVGDALEKEGRSVNVDMLVEKMRTAINGSKMEGSVKLKAFRDASNELQGLMLSADEAGNIPLSIIHRAKQTRGSTINYIDPEKAATGKVVVKALKEFVEDNTNALDVEKFNTELSRMYGIRDILVQLNNRKVEGGRLGKHFAATIGTMVGASAGGPLGAIAGAEAGAALKGVQMKNALGGTFGKPLEVSDELVGALKPTNKVLPQSNKSGNLNTTQSTTIPKTTNVIPKSKPPVAPAVKAVPAPKKPKDINASKERVKDLKLQIEFLNDAINESPARKLVKYQGRGSKQGLSLAEINHQAGGTGNKAAKLDDIASELGFEDTKVAQDALDDYLVQRDNLAGLKAELQSLRKEIRTGTDTATYDTAKYTGSEVFAGAPMGFEIDEETGELVFNEERALMFMAGIAGAQKLTPTLRKKAIETVAKKLTPAQIRIARNIGQNNIYTKTGVKNAGPGELGLVQDLKRLGLEVPDEVVDVIGDKLPTKLRDLMRELVDAVEKTGTQKQIPINVATKGASVADDLVV